MQPNATRKDLAETNGLVPREEFSPVQGTEGAENTKWNAENRGLALRPLYAVTQPPNLFLLCPGVLFRG
jgi:hypothetical protein